MSGFALRFREATERLGFKKQYEIASALGVSKGYLSEIIQGKKMPSDILLNMIEIKLAVRSLWLIDGTGDMFLTREEWDKIAPYPVIGPIDIRKGAQITHIKKESYPIEQKVKQFVFEDDFVFIPQVAGKISAGGGLAPDNTIEITVGFRKEWIARKGDPRQMSLIRVSGDSMEPTLYSGDLVLIDHNRKHVDPQGGIYAITVGEDIMLKRLHLFYPLEKVKIISDNTRYEVIEASMDQITINGKVIWYARELER
jgi:phage repressor protein C with HTH and peptisase S24 domain